MKSRPRLIAVVFILFVVVGSIAIQGKRLLEDRTAAVVYAPNRTLDDLAQANGVLPSELKYCLRYEMPKADSVNVFQFADKSGVSETDFRRAIVRAREDDNPWRFVIRFLLWSILLAAATLWVMRRHNAATIRRWILVGVWFLFGAWLGVVPNPLDSFVAVFQWLADRQGSPILMVGSVVLMAVLSVWGAKLLCGWGCPFGALQEMLFYFRVLPRKYDFHFPFWLSLVIRVLVLAAFLTILFGGWTVWGLSNLYEPVNGFKVFRFPQLTKPILYSLAIFGVLSILMFRPFCQLVCPFGLLAWLLEKVSVYRIHIDPKRCTHCLKCVRACPTQAMKRIYDKKTLLPPDCWSCGECIESCSARAISYKISP
ncbi:MAG: 4Fe-4S binding protein [Phycisphaerae bacterium]|nr:4Fe-4S binding protein [Phycisphaerae bacterium]